MEIKTPQESQILSPKKVNVISFLHMGMLKILFGLETNQIACSYFWSNFISLFWACLVPHCTLLEWMSIVTDKWERKQQKSLLKQRMVHSLVSLIYFFFFFF